MWTAKIPLTIDSKLLFADSLFWGVGIIIALLVASIILLGRSARTHLVMIELVFIGTFGAVSTMLVELRDMNIELDQSPAVAYEVKALDKQFSKTRRSTSYYLYMNDWNNKEIRKKVEVSGAFYRSVSIGDSLVVRQKAGYLKYRWVESIKKRM